MLSRTGLPSGSAHSPRMFSSESEPTGLMIHQAHDKAAAPAAQVERPQDEAMLAFHELTSDDEQRRPRHRGLSGIALENPGRTGHRQGGRLRT